MIMIIVIVYFDIFCLWVYCIDFLCEFVGFHPSCTRVTPGFAHDIVASLTILRRSTMGFWALLGDDPPNSAVVRCSAG